MKPSYLMSWNEYQEHFTKLKEKIVKDKRDYLIALSRGGLVAGTHLSNILDLPLGVMFCSSYKNRKRKDFNITGWNCIDIEKSKRLAIVDDLIDSGTTRAEVLEFYASKKAKFYTLVPEDFKKKIDGRWLVFPWEQ